MATNLTDLCRQKSRDAIKESEPAAAGKKPPAPMRNIERRCTGRMSVAKPMTAASIEKGNIHTAESCISGVITVLEAELKAQSVMR
mmetsp:Transcript_100050/g.223391  ORF Transcript_100050/g.223391 Transcript_100050/m.223391 type:complete len:86 (+) Transcript_100050:431-688(+)